MWIISTPIFSNNVFKIIEPEISGPDYYINKDVIILLSGGRSDYYHRLILAYSLHTRLKLPIIASGQDIDESHFHNLQIQPYNIFIDNKSLDTFQNARNVKLICDKKGFTRPILVTSTYHVKRAKLIFEKEGLKTYPYVENLDANIQSKHSFYNYLPDNFSNISTILKEILGLLHYSFFLK